MKQIISQYIDQLINNQHKRKKLITHQLEDHVKQRYLNHEQYQAAGGYAVFHQILQTLVAEGKLQPLKQAKGNGREPALRTAYWAVSEAVVSQWSVMDMIKLSDRLQLQFYKEHPELQSVSQWQRILSIYQFLQEREQRDWVTREERSLELFGEEKYLSKGLGAQLIRRLGVSLEDLKARVYGEPFVYWPCPGRRLAEAKRLLIVENLSIFHTCKMAMERDGLVLGLKPDVIIYGEGKKIESSLPFYTSIIKTNEHDIHIDYAGDIDPEGWSIYIRLRDRYPQLSIALAASFYETMVQLVREQTQPIQGQFSNPVHYDRVIEELQAAQLSDASIESIQSCWASKQRIPQEWITLESLQRLKAGRLNK